MAPVDTKGQESKPLPAPMIVANQSEDELLIAQIQASSASGLRETPVRWGKSGLPLANLNDSNPKDFDQVQDKWFGMWSNTKSMREKIAEFGMCTPVGLNAIGEAQEACKFIDPAYFNARGLVMQGTRYFCIILRSGFKALRDSETKHLRDACDRLNPATREEKTGQSLQVVDQIVNLEEQIQAEEAAGQKGDA